MIININKDREVIISTTKDKEIYSTKIIDELPEDINQFVYKYINGNLIRYGAIVEDTSLTSVEIEELLLDQEERITLLEFGGNE